MDTLHVSRAMSHHTKSTNATRSLEVGQFSSRIAHADALKSESSETLKSGSTSGTERAPRPFQGLMLDAVPETGSVSESEIEIYGASSYLSNDSLSPQTHSQSNVNKCMESLLYQLALTALVLLNVVLVVIESDTEARGDPVPMLVRWGNFSLTAAFVVDICVRISIFRGSFFHDSKNQLEFAVVLMDVVAFAVSSLIESLPVATAVRALVRLARLAKTTKLIWLFPELGIMLASLVGAMRSLLWGCILLIFTVLVYAIIAVQIIHPINKELADVGRHLETCDRCSRAFESVWMSILTILQCNVAGDAWGQVALPIMQYSPATSFFFFILWAHIHLVIMNIILAMVVENAQLAREENMDMVLKMKHKDKESAKRKLIRLCRGLDVKNSGSLRLEDLEDGIKSNPQFEATLARMEVTQDDLEDVWEILHDEGDTAISYEDFAEQLFKMKATASHTLLILIRHLVASIPRKIALHLDAVKSDIENLQKQFIDGAVLRDASQSDVTVPETDTHLCEQLPELIDELRVRFKTSFEQMEETLHDYTQNRPNPKIIEHLEENNVDAATLCEASRSDATICQADVHLCVTVPELIDELRVRFTMSLEQMEATLHDYMRSEPNFRIAEQSSRKTFVVNEPGICLASSEQNYLGGSGAEMVQELPQLPVSRNCRHRSDQLAVTVPEPCPQQGVQIDHQRVSICQL